jgi:phosphoserine phosphatase RsbU/P
MRMRSVTPSTHDSADASARAAQRSLLEASLDALVIIGPDAKIADGNSALEIVTGLTRSELLGNDASRFFVDPEQARQLYRDVLRMGSVRDRPLELRHRDGHLTSVLCSATSYRDDSGTVLGVVAAAHPVAAFIDEGPRAPVDPWLRRSAHRIVTAASIAAIGVGFAGLARPSLPEGLAALASGTAPAASALFVACGGACSLLRASNGGAPAPGRTLAGRFLAVCVALVAAVFLNAALAGARAGAPPVASHLDAWSATAFLALGLGLWAIDYTVTIGARRYWPAHAFAFVTGMLSIAGILDAVVPSRTPLTQLDLASAIGFFTLALGLVCARTDYGLGALLASPSLGGTMTRWLWPTTVIVPTLLGVSWRHANAVGWFPYRASLPAMILTMITLLGGLVIWNGHRIDRVDRLRETMREALRRREHELGEAHRLARIGSWWWRLEDDRVSWSPELYRITGRDPSPSPVTSADLLGFQTPESAARFASAIEVARHSGVPFEIELTLVRSDGQRRFATARGEVDRDIDGHAIRLRGTIEDITERKLAQAELARVHRAQQASSRCNQILVRATDEMALLQQICQIIIETTDYKTSWVGRAESDAQKTIRLLARAGADDGYVSGCRYRWSSDDDPDAVGTAIRSGQRVLISDIASDPRTSAWRQRALAYGYASLLVIPLVVDDQPFGMLAIYSAEPNAFGSQEVSLLGELADDLSYGLTSLHTRDARARAEAEVRRLNADLEQRVQSRTAELRAANELKDVLLLRQQATSTELERSREREADVGFKIQRTLLLDLPPSDIPGLSVAAHTHPSQRVDGDFYAFLNHDDQVLDVIVGDVMGKGILAALIGAATKAHFLKALGDLAGGGGKATLPLPKDVVMLAHAGVARHLIELESFVTLCYARIDMRERRLDFVDCGHTGIILLHGGSGDTQLLRGDNLPLGVREGELYQQRSIPLEPGDTLLLFSDGITDARNATGMDFGFEQLERLVKENGRLAPGALIEAVGNALSAFSGNARPSDDQTSVAIQVESTTRLSLMHDELELRSNLGELGRARDFVRHFCAQISAAPLDAAAVAELELAANEAVSNIMKHAYSGESDQLIRIEADAFADGVSVRLRHLGSPFSPETAPAPQFDGSRESGFGMYIIRSSVDEVKYYRDANGRSCIALFKKHTRKITREEKSRWTLASK